MNILITGGAGFIGTNLIQYILTHTQDNIINVDKLTYSANRVSFSEENSLGRYFLEEVDICNAAMIRTVFEKYQPDAVMNLAAESHVDRSIHEPAVFMQTNILGTYTLLEAARDYWASLSNEKRKKFRFHHVSTDEVYGDLDDSKFLFTESTPYNPSSPYAASKACSDHLVRAWQRTYNLPTLITNCSNNYGPYQFPEKLIPLVLFRALKGLSIPIYGSGKQIRDWLYVEDHARALYRVLSTGRIGQTYNIGGNNEKTNIEVVELLCDLLEIIVPQKPQGVKNYHNLITFIQDRPGHDQRYAIDSRKIKKELGWSPLENFETGLQKTICWYLANESSYQALADNPRRPENISKEGVI